MIDSKLPKVLVLAYSDVRSDPRIMKQCSALTDAGYDVSFHGVKYTADVINEKFRVKLYFYRSKRRLVQYLQYFVLMAIFLGVQANNIFKKPIIIVHNMPNFLVIPCVLSRFLGSKVVLDLHDDPVLVLSKVVTNKFILAILDFIENSISLRVPNKLMTVNSLLLRSVVERTEKEVFLLHNSPESVLRDCSYKYTKGSPIKLVFIGHLGTHYGLPDLIEYLGRIKNVVPVTLDIFGDGSVRDELEKLIYKFQLQQSVKLHGRFLAKDISPILSRFDLGVALYPKTELTNIILPVKILEYTFNCLPSLTSPLNVTQDYFQKKSLIYIETYKDFKKSLEDIFSGRINLETLHRYALSDVSGISWKQERERFLEFIGKLHA